MPSSGNAAAPLPEPEPPRRWRALAVVVAAQFMFVVDAFIVSVALPSIRSGLQAGPGALAATVAAYQLAYAVLVVPGGRLGDILGRRRVFVAGVLCFSAASLWCAAAGSGGELVLARLVQGAMAALMVPQVLATIHVLFPDSAAQRARPDPDAAPARARAFAVFGVALGLGGGVGFALGGALIALDPSGLGWRAVFLVNPVIGAAVALAALRLMPQPQPPPPRTGAQLDLGGAGLLFLGLACLLGPVMAGQELGWPDWLPLAALAGAALLALFLRQERALQRRGGTPLLDPALLEDRRFLLGLAASFAFQFGNVSFYLVMTLFLQGALGLSALESGLAMVPLALAFTLASRLAGRWAAGRDALGVLLRGSGVQLAGLAALATLVMLVPQPGAALLAAVLLLFGFGQGMVMAPLSSVVLAAVRPGHAGAGAGLLNTVQQAAAAGGVAILGAVYLAGGMEGQPGLMAALALLGLAGAATAGLLAGMRRIQRTAPAPPGIRAAEG